MYSSTDFPATQVIRPHNENRYTLEFPGIPLFACLQAPERGGATTVVDVRRVLSTLRIDLVERFRRYGWLLIWNYPDHMGLPWQTAFDTDDPAEVDRYCAEQRIASVWLNHRTLHTGQRRSAIISHPEIGEETWFNRVAFWSEWTLPEEVRVRSSRDPGFHGRRPVVGRLPTDGFRCRRQAAAMTV